ncbi:MULTISPECIES: ABC transporter permease [Comamonas]|jgi:phospholipid/cholesterol/gamma-HCH transport system permease protein|uniref:ABC transporter permease n=1 Tax=Comamonas squillarum TaxID=2977320 RepID=A0ABY5ZYD3_9BURK|nr:MULTISPECIES: ABC transporter permease [Comamonas]PWB16894.1 ABC transporter permease [Comamonas sp. JNW]UXC17011.1 ABC transporter permease [Comamonas sp. PR12]
MDDTAPHLQQLQDGTQRWAQLRGRWGAAELGQRPMWRELRRQLDGAAPSADQGWDLSEVQWLDHVGAQLLWDHWGQQWPAQLRTTELQRQMLERVASLTMGCPPETKVNWWGWLIQLGLVLLGFMAHVRSMVEMVGQLLLDVLRLIKNPLRGPWRDVSGHLYAMGATALPITALVGFLIGVVLAYLMSLQLRQFGADAFIVNILGISLVRELGPLLGAILVAGRTGSAITAQIGVMRVNEELDAMQVMGIAQGYRLVMPRALALALAMPLVSMWTTVCALVGGMMAADAAMGVSPAYFLQAMPGAVDIANLYLALAKSVTFGVAIALIACHWGLEVEPNTQSLGRGTTSSVVISITAVIVLDAIFAIAFRKVGF